ncbi:hypothetical protein [Alienimonas sp. DA493]|uniref:hypothetical protein n=1 Tax=Alienimonas sp. DA493 TaxID=3373605 RepID=UPI003754FE2F
MQPAAKTVRTIGPELLYIGQQVRKPGVRLALACREFKQNAVNYGATRAWIVCVEVPEGYGLSPAGRYLLYAHDGRPFESMEAMREAIIPNTSWADGDLSNSVYGSGTKTAAFLMDRKPERCGLVYGSRIAGRVTGVCLTATNFNDCHVADWKGMELWLSAMPSAVRSALGKANVFYMTAYANDGLSSRQQSLCTAKGLAEYAHLAGDVESIEETFYRNDLISPGTTLPGHPQPVPTLKHYRTQYTLDSFTFPTARGVELIDESGDVVRFEANVTVHYHPNISGSGSAGRMERLPVDGADDIDAPESGVFLYNEMDFGDSDKNSERASIEPCASHPNVGEKVLQRLNVFANRADQDKVIAFARERGAALPPSEGLKAKPFLTVEVKTRFPGEGGRRDLVGCPGSLFYAPEFPSKVTTAVAEHLRDRSPDEVSAFGDWVRERFPADRTNRMPDLELPSGTKDRIVRKLYFENLDDGGQKMPWNLKATPGRKSFEVRVSHAGTGEPFTLEDSQFKCSDGWKLTHDYEDHYQLMIRDRFVDDVGGARPMTEEEFFEKYGEKLKATLRLEVMGEPVPYHAFQIEAPEPKFKKKPYKKKVGSGSGGLRPRPDLWAQFEHRDLICQFSQGGLFQLNEDHPFWQQFMEPPVLDRGRAFGILGRLVAEVQERVEVMSARLQMLRSTDFGDDFEHMEARLSDGRAMVLNEVAISVIKSSSRMKEIATEFGRAQLEKPTADLLDGTINSAKPKPK